jgi:P pilus assembly chaperone PapD
VQALLNPVETIFSANFYIPAMKPFIKNYFFARSCSIKFAITLMLFLFMIQPGFLVPPFLSSALGETQNIGKGLLVAPVRLEFEGRTRSGTFKILNRDPVHVDYRISFAPLLEKDNGGDAKDWVRFSPRRVRLGPGEHQTVRVVARKPSDLDPGEYTARILIQAIPPARRKSDEPTDKIKINLDIVYGISIPIIIKHNP